LNFGGLARKFRHNNTIVPLRPRHGSYGELNTDKAVQKLTPSGFDDFNGVQSEGENIDVRAPAG
jgi:hypothetical protein